MTGASSEAGGDRVKADCSYMELRRPWLGRVLLLPLGLAVRDTEGECVDCSYMELRSPLDRATPPTGLVDLETLGEWRSALVVYILAGRDFED